MGVGSKLGVSLSPFEPLGEGRLLLFGPAPRVPQLEDPDCHFPVFHRNQEGWGHCQEFERPTASIQIRTSPKSHPLMRIFTVCLTQLQRKGLAVRMVAFTLRTCVCMNGKTTCFLPQRIFCLFSGRCSLPVLGMASRMRGFQHPCHCIGYIYKGLNLPTLDSWLHSHHQATARKSYT